MENEILTGKSLNEAKEKVTDEELEKILKAAQDQINKPIGEEEKKAAREKAAKEKAEQEAKERAAREKAAKEKAEQEAREKAAREKAAKERAEQEAKERAAREKAAKERAEQEAKEKAAREKAAKERAEQEAKERAAREKAAKERAEQEAKGKAAREKEAKEKAEQEAKEKAERENAVRAKTEKENIIKKDIEKAKEEAAVALELEDNVYVDNSIKPVEIEKDRLTVGKVIGTTLEGIWTLFKLAVFVVLVVGVVGFLLSRNMMIRGRNGNRQCTEGMLVSGAVAANKSSEDEKVKEWLSRVKREKLTLEADDGSILVARQIMLNDANNKWVVILHGYNGSMADIYDIAMHYAEEEYNILMPDLRANGESEGSFIGMGWLDRLDVINWIDVILEENPSAEVVIHGIDMGADTALMLSGEPVKSSIKAIVAEGAYTSAWDVTKKEYKIRHEKLSVFPFMNMMNPVMKVWAGYSLKEADAVKQVKKTSIPILLIRGQNDTYVTEDMTAKLDQAIASTHEVLTIEAGTHEDCRYADPDTYYDKTFEFIGNYMD
ncbi:MAG: alpha/beta fold hydrolase [Lachnospiraceae bacterium]